MTEVDRILDLGRKVDPVIMEFLERDADPDFIPVLRHQIESGGKRVRATLTLLSCAATGGGLKDGLIPAAMFELVHNYSLIIDDIIDRGEVRRGLDTVRKKFSDPMALLAAMFYRETLDEMAEAAHPSTEFRRLMRETIKELIEGERRDILFEQAGRESPYIESLRTSDVSFEGYLDMIGKKTAALFKASCLAGGYASKAPQPILDALKEFGWKIGLAFQVMDDYLDIFGEETGKEKGKDIREHKLGNIAIINALNELEGEERKVLKEILSKQQVTNMDVAKALTLIGKTSSKSKTVELAKRLVLDGKTSLKTLPETEAKADLLAIADFIHERLY
ncbi:MAG: polyprenyl synthetase family protein [Candidatus Bathyarchaeia archaeon]